MSCCAIREDSLRLDEWSLWRGEPPVRVLDYCLEVHQTWVNVVIRHEVSRVSFLKHFDSSPSILELGLFACRTALILLVCRLFLLVGVSCSFF